MIIYNVTVNIDESIHDQWLSWIKNHIPEVLATGKFSEAKLTRVLTEEGTGEITYAVQYRAYSREALNDYYQHHANRLKGDALLKFGDKMLAFRTELEIVDEYTVTKN